MNKKEELYRKLRVLPRRIRCNGHISGPHSFTDEFSINYILTKNRCVYEDCPGRKDKMELIYD